MAVVVVLVESALTLRALTAVSRSCVVYPGAGPGCWGPCEEVVEVEVCPASVDCVSSNRARRPRTAADGRVPYLVCICLGWGESMLALWCWWWWVEVEVEVCVCVCFVWGGCWGGGRRPTTVRHRFRLYIMPNNATCNVLDTTELYAHQLKVHAHAHAFALTSPRPIPWSRAS